MENSLRGPLRLGRFRRIIPTEARDALRRHRRLVGDRVAWDAGPSAVLCISTAWMIFMTPSLPTAAGWAGPAGEEEQEGCPGTPKTDNSVR